MADDELVKDAVDLRGRHTWLKRGEKRTRRELELTSRSVRSVDSP